MTQMHTGRLGDANTFLRNGKALASPLSSYAKEPCCEKNETSEPYQGSVAGSLPGHGSTASVMPLRLLSSTTASAFALPIELLPCDAQLAPEKYFCSQQPDIHSLKVLSQRGRS